MSRYRFVEAESSRYPVTQLCRIAQVSRAAYYAVAGRAASARAGGGRGADGDDPRDPRARRAGSTACRASCAELRAQGLDVGRKRVARLMAAAGLRGRRPPRWVRTTTPEPTPPAIPDLVHGALHRARRPTCCGSATSPTSARGTASCTWRRCSTCSRRRVVGWAMADASAHRARPATRCSMAVATRGGPSRA